MFSSIELMNSGFSGLSGTRGAAIYAQKSVANITNCNFDNNQADDSGGILNAVNSVINMSQCKLGNAKSRYGAALSLYSDSVLDMKDSSFLNCES